MKIVVLDGGTTNPGDLSWSPLEALGDLTVYGNTPEGLVTERTAGAQALIVNRIRLSRQVLAQLPQLKYIGTLSTGVNTIDLQATAKRGIPVCNVPEYCVPTVAQAAFALLLALCNHVQVHSPLVRAGKWEESVELNAKHLPITDLCGKTLGILGYGNIGKTVAALGRALGMRVIYYSKTPKACEDRRVSLQELFQQSDVLSLHCALNDETQKIVNAQRLSLMNPKALLINTARGGLIDEAALARALNCGLLGGAGLDVLTREPPQKGNPLLTAKNCLITPHIAWSAPEARTRLIGEVAENLSAYLKGTPRHKVN